MTTVAFIPARGGSQRIVRKNLARIGALPLVGRSIAGARDAGCDRIVVSTDDGEISALASSYGTEVHQRPANLAGPHAQIEDAIAHWMHRQAPVLADDDVIVLLQPTSPFRRAETVRRCIDLVTGGCDSALTVRLDRRAPFRGGRCHAIEGDRVKVGAVVRAMWDRPHGWTRTRSQDVRLAPEETGGVYAFTAGHFRRTRSRMGGNEACVVVDWIEALEIDTPEDLELARILAPHVERLREAA